MAETSARADRQQNFFAEGVLELLELQRRLAFITQHFEYCRPTLFRYFHAAIFEMHHVHLQRLDLEVPVVAAIWTCQRHERFPVRRFSCFSPLVAAMRDTRYASGGERRANCLPYRADVPARRQKPILCNGQGGRNEKRAKILPSRENAEKSVNFCLT